MNADGRTTAVKDSLCEQRVAVLKALKHLTAVQEKELELLEDYLRWRIVAEKAQKPSGESPNGTTGSVVLHGVPVEGPNPS